MTRHRQVVAEADAGQRLDWVLSRKPGIVSRAMAQRLIAEDRVRVGGQPGAPDRAMRSGEVIEYEVPPPRPTGLAPQHGALSILYEDSSLIVLDKPAGLAMHPAPGHPDHTLVNYLLGHCGDLSGIGGEFRPGIVHRLDMDTSGTVVAAKTDEAHQSLAAQFKERTVERTYLALVLGAPQDDKGTIALPLGRHRTHRVKRAVSEHGRRAVTHWWVEQRLPPFCLLRLKLETGRTHQIRVHLAAQEWPVVGDPLYGAAARLKALPLPPAARQTLLAFRRQALHAAELGFTHPATRQRMHFATPVPEDFRALLAVLAGAHRRASSGRSAR
jgi:23S rRNA pseudouridine1911/1915/1917 synthase